MKSPCIHFVFSHSWCSGAGSHSRQFTIILLTNGYTNCCSHFASSILSVVKSIPLIMFVQKFLSSLLSCHCGSGSNRIESQYKSNRIEKESELGAGFRVWDAVSTVEQSSLRMSLEFSCSVTNRRTHKWQWKIHLCCSRR